jgi:hypothetical protein
LGGFHALGSAPHNGLGYLVAKKKKQEAVDDLLDALVWMRRNAKRHEAVDDLIDALIKMRRKAKKKAAKQSTRRKPRRRNPQP